MVIPKKEDSQPGPSEDIQVEQILKECMDSLGYVVFVGVYSKERDFRGNNLINFRYRRFNFAFEDVKRAVEEFGKQYKQDVDLG